MHDGDATEESRFLARLVAREERAFTELILLYEQRVYRLVLRLLRDPEEAREVAQEAFLQVFRSIETFRGESTLSTWLFRIAVNLAKNRRVSLGRRAVRQGDNFDPNLETAAAGVARGWTSGEGQSPDAMAEGRQLEVIVGLALASVDDEFRDALILRDVEQLAYEEIAALLQLPPGTVKSRIHRGRAQLRELVAKRLQGDARDR